MSRIGRKVRVWAWGAAVAAAGTNSGLQAAEPTGGAAKISLPQAAAVADPFAALAPIPTPIVTSSGRVSETAPTAPAGLTPLAPLSNGAADAAPLSVIGAGKLVPLESTGEAAAPQPAKSPASESTAPPPPRESEPAKLRAIETPEPRRDLTAKKSPPAAESKPVEAKPAAVKRSVAQPKPVETPSERAAPAVNFSFPQPVIPLESSLRKWLRWSTTRR